MALIASVAHTRLMGQHHDLVPVSLEPTPVIEAYKRDVDRTLLRENLKLTPDQRVRKMIAALRLAEEVRRAGREARRR
jgi:hypothetical protein